MIRIKLSEFFRIHVSQPASTKCKSVLVLFEYTLCVLSHFCCVRLFATLWTQARQAPLSMGFSRQEYWSGLPCPPLGDLCDPAIKPRSPMPPKRVSYSACVATAPLRASVISSLCARVPAQSRPTLCGPMDCGPPGPSVHGILQARTLKGAAVPSSRGSS